MSPVTESLLINGKLRLYWELSHTLAVHDTYRSVQYLEYREHNQSKDTTEAQKQKKTVTENR